MRDEICRFGLIVTGRGEEAFLPRLFRSLMKRAACVFEVICRVSQRSPIVSPERIIGMVRTGQRLPRIDEEEIGIPVLGFLRRHPGSYAMVVDDLEGDRRSIAGDVFKRYRTALDEVLGPSGMSSRAAVHFLVNMLEAYYYADSQAVNDVASRAVLRGDHPTDVEEIRHPKNSLKKAWPEYKEMDHGEKILRRLRVEHVLSRPDVCCWLRSMFAWCVWKLSEANAVHDETIIDDLCLRNGCQSPTTSAQHSRWPGR